MSNYSTYVGATARVTTSDSAPSGSGDGDMWWNSTTGVLKIYYEDANTSQWVDASPSSQLTTAQYNALAQVSSLAAKAPLASPTFTGVPAAPTASAGTNTTQVATTAFVEAATVALVEGAPGTLQTLDNLAQALNDDANFAGTVTTSIATKAPLASPALTGVPTAPTASSGTDTTQVATTAFVTGAISAAPDVYNTWLVKTADYTALSGDQLLTNHASTAFTITLPSGPSAGNTVIICNAGAALVTVGRNSSNINSAAADGTVPEGNSVQLVYVDSTIGWFEV